MKETVTLVACRDRAQARRIAKALVRERLAACVNVVPGATSIYRWEGKVEEASEVLLLIKSRAALSKRLVARVRALHSYAVPEVVTLPVVAGSAAYLRWVRESTRSGAMPCVELGRYRRYEWAAVEGWLQSCKKPGRSIAFRGRV